MSTPQREIHVGGFLQARTYATSAWFRVFAYGLQIKDTRGERLCFSDRNLDWKAVRVGRFILRVLVP